VKTANSNDNRIRPLGNIGGMTSGSIADARDNTYEATAYLDRKPEGNKSMPSKPERWEGVYRHVRQASHDTVKAGLPEPQLPGQIRTAPDYHAYSTRGCKHTFSSSPRTEVTGLQTVTSEVTQGNERGTYVVLVRQLRVNVGSPTGRESYGDGAAVVVRGWENQPHGEGRQVTAVNRLQRFA
jgi:hypothetical protein